MSAPTAPPVVPSSTRAVQPRPPVGTPAAPRPGVPWAVALCAGLAVVLASAPLAAIVQGWSWLGAVVVAVLIVVATGLVLHRTGPAVVVFGQLAAVLLLITGRYSGEGVFGVLPGPAALGRMGALLAGAGEQISTTVAPVPATPEILFLITAAFGIVATAVHLAAVGLGAPAAAGIPLLATFAVPAALAAELLPWWAMAAATGGFGLLLVARRGARRQLVGGIALVTVAGVTALGVGEAAGFVGTAGRFADLEGSGGSGAATGVGLSPFAALRGQLTQRTPTELFEVTGLPQPTYLRALTLRDFQPRSGWAVAPPDSGPALPGSVPAGTDVPGEVAEITVENLAFRDYWLPLYGVPLAVDGLEAGRWSFDVRDGIAYTARPRQEDGWTQRALFPQPTIEQLRAAEGRGPGREFLATGGLDPRVVRIAEQVAGDEPTDFDKAIALQEFFTGPGSEFRYDLATAPSGGDDALVEFLTVGRRGYCEQYASAMAIMLRALDVPARVAVGFTAGVPDGDGRIISTSDAHAWVEAWFPGIGWTAFDPTPLTDGRTITPPYVAEALAERSGGGSAPEIEELPADEGPETAPVPETPTPETPEEPVSADTGGGVPLWPFVVLLALGGFGLAALAPAALRRSRRARRLAAVDAGGPGAAAAAWEELLAESTDRGVAARPSDTVRGTARMMIREHRLGTPAQEALRHLVTAVEASWYGGGHPAPGELAEPLRIVREGIAAGTPLTLRERLLPRSMRRRGTPAPQDDPAQEASPTGQGPTG